MNKECNINEKLTNIENDLVNVLDLIDYKKLCEEKLGYKLNQNNINEFITKYTKFLDEMYEVKFNENDSFASGVLVIFTSFMLACINLMVNQSLFIFFGIILLGFLVYCILKHRNRKKCEQTKKQLKKEWKEYRSKLPYKEKIISIMEDIVYDHLGKFKYPYVFYKELYLKLKNNIKGNE